MNAAVNSPNEAFVWSDSFKLGYDPMDETHEEFVEIVSCLLTAPESELVTHLEAFKEHAIRHFGEEDEWMVRTEFPARDCHIDEHAAVLKSVNEVLELARQGDLRFVRGLAQELARWFPGHADYLDSALAQWMFKREYGGKPMVLRRSIQSPLPSEG